MKCKTPYECEVWFFFFLGVCFSWFRLIFMPCWASLYPSPTRKKASFQLNTVCSRADLGEKCLVPGLPLPPTFFVPPDTSVPPFPHLQNKQGCYADKMRPFVQSTPESVRHVVGCGLPSLPWTRNLKDRRAGGPLQSHTGSQQQLCVQPPSWQTGLSAEAASVLSSIRNRNN